MSALPFQADMHEVTLIRRLSATSGLVHQLQPFRAQTVIEQHKAGGVAARPRQTIDIAGADWIDDGHEHNRHGPCRLQQRRHMCGALRRPYRPIIRTSSCNLLRILGLV